MQTHSTTDRAATEMTTDPNRARLSAWDAIAQLNGARMGSLVKLDGGKLDGRNLSYLRALRNHIFEWSDAIDAEIARIERLGVVRTNGGDL